MSIQKRIRFSFLFLSAIFRKQYRLILIGVLLGVFFFTATPFLIKYFPRQKSQIVIGRTGQWTINELPEDILNEISLGLTKVSGKGEILPSLAESWRVEDEGKTYFFQLKSDGFFWHDGKKFSLQDINYNFKDVVLSFENGEVVFKLKEPFSPFPSIVSKPIFKKGLIGIGDYKIKKIIRSGKYLKSVSLSPFSGKSLPPKLYKFYPIEKDLKTAFNLGEINIIEDIFDIDGILAGESVSFQKNIRKDVYLGVFFNNSKTVFQQKNFRQALAYAIPKVSGEQRALTPLNPSSWAYNQDVKPYNEDLKRAKSLLTSESESIKNITIVISTLPQYEKIAKEIAASWKNLGLNVEISFFSILPTDYDVLLVAREIPSEPDQYYFWHSTQAGNISNFKNPRIDKLLEDGRKISDKEERKNIYFDFQRFLAEESPVVFLLHPESWTVTRNSVLN